MTEEKALLLGSSECSSPPTWRSCVSNAFRNFSCLSPAPMGEEESGTTSDIESLLTMDHPSDNEPLPQLPSYSLCMKSSLTTGEKLYRLRKLMRKHGIAVYLVPSEDEHQSEDTALSDRRREFMSGFNGSAGICVITLDDADLLEGQAALSTDGRYFLQAEKQLDPKHWLLLKAGMKDYPSWQQFAIQRAKESTFSSTISCDPRYLSLSSGEYFATNASSEGVKFEPLYEDLVGIVWGTEKPTRSKDKVYFLDERFSGESSEAKIQRLREKLVELDVNHLVITALDDIGWLLNLRADNDIPYSPFFFSYAIVTLESITLYAEKVKLTNVIDYLCSIKGFILKDYSCFYDDLQLLKATVTNPDLKIAIPEKNACNYALLNSFPDSIAKRTIKFESIVSVMKLTKNPTELMNAKITQNKDSLAFIIFSSWLEHQLIHKQKTISEYEAAQKIFAIRSRFPNFKGLPYETISSTGANAAIIHYAPTEFENSIIDPKVPYLLDSGGHYLEGTTDITRTYKFGSEGVNADYKKYYTLVLKGHLAVAMAKFPAGSTASGTILDSYARQPLWNEGLDFNHGTGHGVGSFGNVHEGPLYISTTAGGVSSKDYFKKGAILTDEPGYYIDGECGFRIESELEIIECDESFGDTRNGGPYLGFKYLTKVPFCMNLIEKSLLSPSEIKWINDFHSSLRAEFGERLLAMGEGRAYGWLWKETRPI